MNTDIDTTKCPNCGELVTSDYVDNQRGLTPIHIFRCGGCGCHFRKVVPPSIPLLSLVYAVPEEVLLNLRCCEYILMGDRMAAWDTLERYGADGGQ